MRVGKCMDGSDDCTLYTFGMSSEAPSLVVIVVGFETTFEVCVQSKSSTMI
jgi:hypothetical protein